MGAEFEHIKGQGDLFQNPHKRSSDNQPDFSGTVKDPHGKTWRIAGWLRRGKAGTSLALAMGEPHKGMPMKPREGSLYGGSDQ